jgi:hypothetical protein
METKSRFFFRFFDQSLSKTLDKFEKVLYYALGQLRLIYIKTKGGEMDVCIDTVQKQLGYNGFAP